MNDAAQPRDVATRRRMPVKDAALALPALVRLLYRLVRDPRVDRRRRLVALGAVAYAVSPVDLIPEAVPVIGKADDVLVTILAVRMLLDGAPEGLLEEHWDGPPEVLEVFDDMVDWAASLVPRRLRLLLSRMVER